MEEPVQNTEELLIQIPQLKTEPLPDTLPDKDSPKLKNNLETDATTDIEHSLLKKEPTPENSSNDILSLDESVSTQETSDVETSSDEDDTDQKVFACDGLMTKNKTSLIERRTCLECKRIFTNYADLVRHSRSHTGEKLYLCQVCGMTFTRKFSLNNHERIHSRKIFYPCQVCKQKFEKKTDLIEHGKIHTEEKPYLCKNCGKFFASKSNLIVHKKLHNGIKPFKCSECGKEHAQKANLIRHYKSHLRGTI